MLKATGSSLTDSGNAQVHSHCRLVVVGREPSLTWRMTAGNGRVLGASAGGIATREDLSASFRELADRCADLCVNYSHPGSGVGWRWIAAPPDRAPMAQCARSYERRATCVAGFERFVIALCAVAVEL